MATIPGTLAVGAVRHPDRAAVVFGERSHSYAGLDGAVNRAALSWAQPDCARATGCC